MCEIFRFVILPVEQKLHPGPSPNRVYCYINVGGAPKDYSLLTFPLRMFYQMLSQITRQTTPHLGITSAVRKIRVDPTDSIRISPLIDGIIVPWSEPWDLVNQNQINVLRKSRCTSWYTCSHKSPRVQVYLAPTR